MGCRGAKSDGGDAQMLRLAAQDSSQAEAVKVLARTHKTLVWERAAVAQRLRAQLLEYFPAAVTAFERSRLDNSGRLCKHRSLS
jgi:hypothetical protein